jgi:hypothetical protein
VVVLGVLWLVRVRGPLLVVLALAVSGLVSFVLLRHQRVAMGAEIHRRVATIKARSAERTAREDAAVDAMLEHDGLPEDGLPQGGVGAGKTGSERT